MKRLYPILALALIAGIALSQNAPQQRQRGQGGSGINRALDGNRDGVISGAEIDNAARALLTLDADKDGRLSAEELSGGNRAERQRGRDRDANPGYRMPTLAFRTDVPAQDYNVVLGRPTANEITLSLLAYKEMDARILCGPSPGEMPIAASVMDLKAGEARDIRLTGLQPNRRYHYRIDARVGASSGPLPGPSKTFHTARTPGATFVFTVQADSHLDFGTVPELYANTLRNVVADRSDFHIALGDTFMVDKRTRFLDAAPQYLAQRYYFSLLSDSTPLYFVLGNHDGEFGYRPEMADWSGAMRKQYIPNPSPNAFYTGNTDRHPRLGALEDYYAWQWGDAHFICLDPFRYTTERRGGQWNKTLGEQQYRWFKRTLETSKAKFKFVFIHYLVGGLNNETRGAKSIAHLDGWGGNNADGVDEWRRERPGWEEPIHDLCVKHGVDIVYHGHDHLYVKEELDGVIYQEVPQPGHRRFNNTRSAKEYGYDGEVFGSSGHIRVTVGPDEVKSEYVFSILPGMDAQDWKNREVAHAYTIRQ